MIDAACNRGRAGRAIRFAFGVGLEHALPRPECPREARVGAVGLALIDDQSHPDVGGSTRSLHEPRITSCQQCLRAEP